MEKRRYGKLTIVETCTGGRKGHCSIIIESENIDFVIQQAALLKITETAYLRKLLNEKIAEAAKIARRNHASDMLNR